MRLIDADEYTQEINNRTEAALKWGRYAIADRNEEIRIRAEQAVATFCEASLTVKKMPTIEAEPIRHGKWIHDKSRWKNRWICSECGYKWFLEPTEGAYCPSCGAHMDKGET